MQIIVFSRLIYESNSYLAQDLLNNISIWCRKVLLIKYLTSNVVISYARIVADDDTATDDSIEN